MTTTEARNKLRDHPVDFLKYYPVNVAGISNGLIPNQANGRGFHIFKRENPGGTQGHLGATRPGSILPFVTHDISSFKIEPGGGPVGAAQFQGLAVPMVYYDQINIAAMDAYLLDASANFMITGQLSNCCFCIVPYAGGLACAHVNPRGCPGGVMQLKPTLTAGGAFTNYPGAFVTFGRQDYAAHAIVIGVRVAGAWNIFSQQSTDLFRTMTHAERIYPAPLTRL